MQGINKNNEPYYKTRIGTMTIRNEGYIEYKPHEQTFTHEIAIIKEEYDWIMQKMDGKRMPFISYNTGLKKMRQEEMQFFHNHTHHFASSFAAIVKPGISKFIMHYSLLFYHHPIPIKLFTNEKSALAWINDCINT